LPGSLSLFSVGLVGSRVPSKAQKLNNRQNLSKISKKDFVPFLQSEQTGGIFY